MAKKRGRPKTSERTDVAVKIDRAVAAKAKAIATHRGTSVAEVLSELARPAIDKAYAAMLRELEASDGKAWDEMQCSAPETESARPAMGQAKTRRIQFIRNALGVLGEELDGVPDAERDERWYSRDRDRARLQDKLNTLLGIKVERPKSPGELFLEKARSDREQALLEERAEADARVERIIDRGVKAKLRAEMPEKRQSKAEPKSRHDDDRETIRLLIPDRTVPVESDTPAEDLGVAAASDHGSREDSGSPTAINTKHEAPDETHRSPVEPVYSLAEAATRLGVSRATILSWIDRGLRASRSAHPRPIGHAITSFASNG